MMFKISAGSNRIIILTAFLICSNVQSNAGVTITSDLDWAAGLIWYQIFPERFCNGDSFNDPTAQEVFMADQNYGWKPHPWTSDWYQLQPWEKQKSSKFYDVVLDRRYGGDLIGVIQKLDYLKHLGIGGIYFNPVFEAASLHKYDGSTYHHIDDNFGPDPKRDKARLFAASETDDPSTWIWTSADSTFLLLIQEAHKRDIKIVIDGVFNHTGTAFFAFQDIVKNQQKSKYAHWFDIKAWDDPATEKNEFDYQGWWGHKSLPELAEDENGIVSGPREYIMYATKRWLDPNGDGDPADGIDGWRLDVAAEVAKPFWQEWNAYVKSINQAAITVAEIWDDAADWITSGCFDGTMNYMFAYPTIKFFVNKRKVMSGNEFVQELKQVHQIYGSETSQILWNMLDSHDTDRLASMIINPDRDYDRHARPSLTNDYNVRKPSAQEREIQKQITAFQLTYPGAPVIYYGTEAGLWGADDPDDRKPMLWPELAYDDEESHPVAGRSRPIDKNEFDQELYNFYRDLVQIRKNYPVLRYGDLQFIAEATSAYTIGFSREYENDQMLAFFNRGPHSEKIIIPKLKARGQNYVDVLSAQTVTGKGSNIEVTIPPSGYLILIKK